MHLRKTLQDVRSSLWFVPGLLVASSMGLAFLLVEVPRGFGDTLTKIYPRFFATSLVVTKRAYVEDVLGDDSVDAPPETPPAGIPEERAS